MKGVIAAQLTVLCSAALTVAVWAWAAPAEAGSIQERGDRGSATEASSDVSFFGAVLSDPSMPDLIRRGAAQRLVRDGSPEAMQMLERAIRGNGPQQAAAVDAIDQALNGRSTSSTFTLTPQLESALVDAAVGAPLDGGPNVRSVVARVLAGSAPQAAERLAAVALDTTVTPRSRQGAIATLGELRTRDAAGHLIRMLEAGRREDRETVSAVCAALARSTGAVVDPTPDAWLAWWNNGGSADQVDESHLRAMAAALATAEQALADEERRGELLRSRLIDAYGQLFLRLNQQERLQRGAALLTDEMPALREFALGQFERMLRNGEPMDTATRTALLATLDDPIPGLRVRGARLLADLGVPDLAMRLAERLPRERDPAVSAAFLAALSSNPEARTFPTLVVLLKDPQLNEAACRAVITLADARRLGPEWQATLLQPLRETVAARPNAASVQLLTMAGDEADLQRAITLLDDADAAVRRGAAEGLRRRGVRRPVLERSSDPAIFVPYVAAVADEAKSLDTLRLLVAASPPSNWVPDWNAAVVKVLRELPLADLPAADALLESAPACERRTRLEGLGRLIGAARTTAPQSALSEGLPRWIDLLVAEGRASQAMEQIEALAPDAAVAADRPLVDALFRAKALSGEFRGAADLRGEPDPWLELLASVVRNTALARPLADEISLRFGSTLSGDQVARLERLRREFPAAPTAAPTTADAPELRP